MHGNCGAPTPWNASGAQYPGQLGYWDELADFVRQDKELYWLELVFLILFINEMVTHQ